jgi:type IV secretion system protein VirB8
VKNFFKKDKTVNEVKNWYQDRYESVLIQRNTLFIFLLLLIIFFGIGILQVIKLNSEKVYEPFVVQVEENTGIITKVNNKTVRELTAIEAVRNASLVKYIISREGYTYADYNFNYYTIVRLMSNSDIYSIFRSQISPSNPESPLTFGIKHRMEVNIKTIIDLDEDENLVQIRISKSKVPTRGGNPEWKKDYVIKLKYAYKNLNLTEEQRYINPLGIQIIAYEIYEETNTKNI